MKIRGKKEKDKTSKYNKSSKAGKIHTLEERRKTMGKNLSFAAAEAYKLLRTNLIFSMPDESACKIIGITSSLRGEGKTTTAINLAYTMAETNKKVLLIEADMRIPVLAKTLCIDSSVGLSNVLAGVNQLGDAVCASPLLESLFLLPAGEIPPNPSELLLSPRMEQVFSALSGDFHYIIVDLPPVNEVSDSLAISKLLSGMVMVVRQNYCAQHALANAMRQMEFLNVKLLGFVMNYSDSDGTRYKKYGYKYKKRSYGYDYSYRKYAESTDSKSQEEAAKKAGV